MQFFIPSGQGPVTWWKGKPIYITTILILIHVVALVITTFMLGVRADLLIQNLACSATNFLQGKLWSLFTFPILQVPSFWIFIELLMLWMFGMQVEQIMGWKKYLRFYLVLCFSPAVAMLLFAPIIRGTLVGTDAANFSIFIAFATFYPDAPMLFNTKAKWWAWGLLSLIFLQSFASHDVTGITTLCTAGVAYTILRFQGVQGGFSWVSRWKENRQLKRWEAMNQKRHEESTEYYVQNRVDPILDKIAREGIQSLTNEERNILAKAKDKLESP